MVTFVKKQKLMSRMLNSLSDLKNLAVSNGKKKLVLCAAGDEHSIDAVFDAYRAGVIEPILVARKEELERFSENCRDFKKITVHYEADEEKIIRKSIELVVNGQADILMKGNVTTAALLRGVLNKEYGLREKRFLSHFALFEVPNYHKLLGITDVALNILPPLKHKVRIVQNAIRFVRSIGIENPKIAALSAIEMVNEDMPSTIDAALLSIMQRRGQIKNCLIDGPLAFDNAISKASKEQKKIGGDVAGDADILLVPNIESGNILYKAFVFFADAKVAGVVTGAPFPIVLTSRADSEETKLNSIYLAAFSVKN
jgi:phosphate butyryltransferase